MKYFKDENNQVYAYESDGSQDVFIPQGLTPISGQEAMAIASPPPTAGEMIATAQARINANYQSAVNALTAGYPDDEIASWPKQEAEVRAWILNANTPTPWLDAAATARGISKSDLISKVITNADALAPLHGALTGKRQKLRDQIAALGSTPTQAQLDAVQW